MAGSGISAADIWKSFPGVQALRAAHISAPAREIVALVGRNGAGKTVLMSILSGVLRPDRGRIALLGQEVNYHTPAAAQRLGIAMVSQELRVVPQFSALENIALHAGYPARIGVVDWGQLEDRVRPVLARLGTHFDLRRPVRELGPGDQRAVMIAGALSREETVLILDEPTVAFTRQEVNRLFDIVRELAASGTSVIYVTQRLGEVFDISTQVCVLRDGETILQLPTSAVSSADLIEAMTGSPRIERRVLGSRRTDSATELLRIRGLALGPLESIDLVVREGEIVGVFGLMGSGKSTLASVIAGSTRASQGEILIRGKTQDFRSPRHAMRRGIMLSPQDRSRRGLVPTMGLRENVTLPQLRQYQVGHALPLIQRSRQTRDAANLASRVDVMPRDDLERPVRLLSGGNQQKAVLARCLAARGDLYIFDEPTAGLDIQAKEDVQTLIRELVRRGEQGGEPSVAMSTHKPAAIVISSDFEDFQKMCDRVYVLREGKVAGELRGEDVSESSLIAMASGGSRI